MSRLGKLLAIVFVVGVVPATALAAAGSSTLPGNVAHDRRCAVSRAADFGERVDGHAADRVRQQVHREQVGRRRRGLLSRAERVDAAFASGHLALLARLQGGVDGQGNARVRSVPLGGVQPRERRAGARCVMPFPAASPCGPAARRSAGAAAAAVTPLHPVRPTTRPPTRTARSPASPLAPSQRPVGAWNGRELLLFVSGYDPEGKRWPARFARAAAYNPATNTWRRLAPLPTTEPALREQRRLGRARGSRPGRRRRIASHVRVHAGDQHVAAPRSPPVRPRRLDGRLDGNAVGALGRVDCDRVGDPARRSRLRPADQPLDVSPDSAFARALLPAVAWTGRDLIVWGGVIGTPLGTHVAPSFPRDGAAFRPVMR